MFLFMMLSCFGVYVCVCFGVKGKPQALFLQEPPTLFFETGSHAADLRVPASVSRAGNYKHELPGFLCRCWGLNSGPHSFMTNTLLTGSSTHPLFAIYKCLSVFTVAK